MAVILLDRNVVSTCGKIVESAYTGKMINIKADRKRQLRKLNSSSNQISVLFSIIEGSKEIDETAGEKENTIEDELYIIKKYFKKARTDSQFFLENKKITAQILSENYVEENGSNYQKFIYEMHSLLFQPVSKEKRRDELDKIFEVAHKYNISQKHLVVICSIAVLYGNDEVRKIFKFTNKQDKELIKRKSYNTYNDIMVITRVLRLILLLKDKNRNDQIKFFTFDEPLNYLINSLIVEHTKIEKRIDGGVNFEVTINYKIIFNNLLDDEIKELINKINDIKY